MLAIHLQNGHDTFAAVFCTQTMKKIVTIISIWAAVLGVCACGHHHSHSHSHSHEASEGHSHEASVASEQHHHHHDEDEMEFETEEVQLAPFGGVIHAVGQILPSQEGSAEVVATASAVVSLTNPLDEGLQVATGATLLHIETAALTDNNHSVHVMQVENEYRLAKAEYERKAALAEDKIVSESELAVAKAAYESAQVAYNNISKNYSLSKVSLVAPCSGAVTEVYVQNGQYVSEGDAICSISGGSQLLLKAEVASRYYSELAHICGANIKVGERVVALSELGGKLLSYGKAVSASNPLVPVYFTLSGDFLPGTFVDLYINTTDPTPTLSVPNGALVEEMGAYFVFVEHAHDDYDKTPVKIGRTNGVRTEILEGLEAGMEVVSKDAILLKLQQAAGGMDPHAGHSH